VEGPPEGLDQAECQVDGVDGGEDDQQVREEGAQIVPVRKRKERGDEGLLSRD